MKKLNLVVLLVLILSSCKPLTIAYLTDDTTFYRTSIKKSPPQEVFDHKNLATVKGSNVKYVSSSPAGAVGVVVLEDRSTSIETQVLIYDLLGKLILDADEADLKKMIEKEANLEYPKSTEIFIVFGVAWKSVNELILEIQPSDLSVESTPSNVSLVYNVASKKVISVDFYERASTSPVASGSFSQKGVYPFSVSGGNLIIDGNVIQNMPSTNINNADISVLKK